MKRKISSGFQLWAAGYAVLTVVSAVSAEEKKADIKSSSIKINSCIPSPELKKLNSYLPL